MRIINTGFTTERYEFIPAWEIVASQKKKNDESLFEQFISICEKRGISDCRAYMDYLILSDFILSNTDRHLNNIGVIRDSESRAFIGMAPIYDTGNSMFWNISSRLDRRELMEQPVKGFAKKQEKLLSYVTDRECISFTNLLSEKEVEELLLQHGIPRNRTEVIVENYKGKTELFYEFQQGKELSVYSEKNAQKTGDSRERNKKYIR